MSAITDQTLADLIEVFRFSRLGSLAPLHPAVSARVVIPPCFQPLAECLSLFSIVRRNSETVASFAGESGVSRSSFPQGYLPAWPLMTTSLTSVSSVANSEA